jgi:fused signal recognition particle receptor
MFHFLKSGFQKVKQALSRTRSLLGQKLRALFAAPWSEETIEELELALYEADLGSALVKELIQKVRGHLRLGETPSAERVLEEIRSQCLALLKSEQPPPPTPSGVKVVLVVGVNGSGKTTSLIKLAKIERERGRKLLLAAADTFRAAAVEQLERWAERLALPLIKGKMGGDPSAVVFDAVTAAQARACDLVLIDTAGRLQNKADLMQELGKIRRTAAKVVPSAPHETLLVLDATTGQNALDQARIFHQVTPITGIILTKIDGSAKGGIALAIYKELGIPILWLGTGEGEDDLVPFDAEAYVSALFE